MAGKCTLVFRSRFLSSLLESSVFIQRLTFFGPRGASTGLRLPSRLCAHILRMLRGVGARVSSCGRGSGSIRILETLLCRILVLLRQTCRGTISGRRVPASGRAGGARVSEFVRLIKARLGRRRSIRFCTSGLYVAPGCLGRVVASMVKIDTGRCVRGGIVSRTGELLTCASTPVSSVTFRLRFSAISCFVHHFQRRAKRAPLLCHGGCGPWGMLFLPFFLLRQLYSVSLLLRRVVAGWLLGSREYEGGNKGRS